MRAPASVPSIALLAGAALGTAAGDRLGLGLPVAAMVVGLGVGAVSFARRANALLAASVALVFCAGGFALAVRSEAEAAHPALCTALSAVLGQGPVALEGRLEDDGAEGESGEIFTLGVERWSDGRAWHPASGGVRLVVGGSMGFERLGTWRRGRLVRLPALLRLPGRYQDPGVPDSRLALARRGVALVGSVKSAALVEVIGKAGWADELARGRASRRAQRPGGGGHRGGHPHRRPRRVGR